MPFVAGEPWRFSPSQLSMIAKCPRQWQFAYVDGIRRPPGFAAVIGTGAHGGIEADLGNKMATGELLPEEAVKEAAARALKAEWDKGTPVGDEVDEMGPAKAQGFAVDTAVQLAAVHHRELAPKIQPISVERSWALDLEGRPYGLSGRLDVEEETRIRDTKTKAKSPTQTEVDRSIQFTAYAFERASQGRPVTEMTMDVLLRTSRPTSKVFSTHRGPDDFAALLDRADRAWTMISAGAFPPGQPDGWWCSEKWCGYWHMCEGGSRKAVSVGLIDPAKLVRKVKPAATTEVDDGLFDW